MAAQPSTAVKLVLDNAALRHVLLWGTRGQGDFTRVRVPVRLSPPGDGVGLSRTRLRSVRVLVGVIAGGERLRPGSGTVVCSPGVVCAYTWPLPTQDCLSVLKSHTVREVTLLVQNTADLKG